MIPIQGNTREVKKSFLNPPGPLNSENLSQLLPQTNSTKRSEGKKQHLVKVYTVKSSTAHSETSTGPRKVLSQRSKSAGVQNRPHPEAPPKDSLMETLIMLRQKADQGRLIGIYNEISINSYVQLTQNLICQTREFKVSKGLQEKIQV